MVYLLLDNPSDSERLSFLSRHIHAKEVYSPVNKKLMVAWLKGAYRCLCLSEPDDCIVCWYDFQAVLFYFLELAFFKKKRKIVCLNILLKDKDTWKNKVVSYMYKVMLSDMNVMASVTSKEYGVHVRERLGINKELFLLHDVFYDSYTVKSAVRVNPNTVFCGGRNGRDWNFIIKVAKAMPDVTFHLVMPNPLFKEYGSRLPDNVNGKSNLGVDDFMREMCSCEIVALPLDTEAPAGLIVLFQAAANKKYVITTDTMTTREYLSEGRGCLIPNDVRTWTKAIRDKLGRVDTNMEASEKLLKFLNKECSVNKYVEQVNKILDRLQS